MERMINGRLVWYLEKHKLLSPAQCGFRNRRSTTDHLVRLETFVREAFILPCFSIWKKPMIPPGSMEA